MGCAKARRNDNYEPCGGTAVGSTATLQHGQRRGLGAAKPSAPRYHSVLL